MADWDFTFDLVVVGSGGAGLTAAIVARDRGLSAVVLEKTEVFGGSTALSGGGMWIPNNALMRRAGVPDSYDEALAYIQTTVGDQVPRIKQETYVREAPRMLDFLLAQGLHFRRTEGYSDYYPEKPGSNTRSRMVEAALFHGREMRDLYPRVRMATGLAGSLAMTTSEYHSLGLVLSTPKTFLSTGWVMLRNAWQSLTRRHDMTMGKSLIGQLLLLASKHGVYLWSNSPFVELVSDHGCVIGIVAEHEGHKVRIKARRGVC